MQKLTPRQLAILVVLTLVWGCNWSIMKVGIAGFPSLTFRAISMLIGLPLLALVLLAMKLPFRVPRAEWRELAVLSLANMIIWHILIMLALRYLSSGRAAILGYTMPVFSAVLGALFFGNLLTRRAWGGVAAAAVGVALLLWHELTSLSGKPLAVFVMLTAAACWALGTQLLRRTRMTVPTLTISFWMTALGTVALSLAALSETAQWHAPSAATWGAILFNAIGVFVFAHSAWFYLARVLPPVASTLSVMMIPVIGVFTGALWLAEVLHWQDWAAVLLMAVAIASVLAPQRGAAMPPAGVARE